MPQTQLSFLGGPAGELSRVAVRGSVSGLHAGRARALLAGRRRELRAERAVRARRDRHGQRHLDGGGARAPVRLRVHGRRPDPIARLPEPGTPDGPPGTVLHFASAPAIDPAALTVTVDSAGGAARRRHLPRRLPGAGRDRPEIFDPRGQLVWFKPLPSRHVRRQRARPALPRPAGADLVAGHDLRHGFGLGEGEIYSTSYRHVATVHAGDGLAEDLHELQLEPDGTALITAWKPLYCDLAAVGGPADGAVYDASFQEIDIRTGPRALRVGLARPRAAERLLHAGRAAPAPPGPTTGSTSTRSRSSPTAAC